MASRKSAPRKRSHFLKADYPQATADLAEAIARLPEPYPILWRYLARAGGDGAADLAAAAAQLKTKALALSGRGILSRQAHGRGHGGGGGRSRGALRSAVLRRRVAPHARRSRQRRRWRRRRRPVRRASTNMTAPSPSSAGSTGSAGRDCRLALRRDVLGARLPVQSPPSASPRNRVNFSPTRLALLGGSPHFGPPRSLQGDFRLMAASWLKSR
jgi:hypothetical protein